ncbi:MAG: nitroreductase family deazaflavin-dependent oxidoreductase [Anaerolineales bacterium]|nr:nitroreductase family deazaflavin-dependent oxidoreductase [Anaerolineales bacterium]
MSSQQRLVHGFGWVLKHTLNPLTLRLARAGHGPFALVQHVGRRSGKLYETPLIVARVPGGVMAELTYGPSVDWYQNVRAAGGCTVLDHGRRYTITAIAPVAAEEGRAAFPLPARVLLRLLRRSHFVKLSGTAAPA